MRASHRTRAALRGRASGDPAIAVDGVPEHRQHEPALPLERRAPRERRTEEDVRLERRLEEIHRHLVMLCISGTGRPAGPARVVS